VVASLSALRELSFSAMTGKNKMIKTPDNNILAKPEMRGWHLFLFARKRVP
jgi:hypothetical protein